MDEATLFRLGGYSALAAVPALLLAGVFLALFFGGFGDRYGPLNDIFSALVLLLSVAPALAVAGLLSEQTGGWFGVLTGLAVLGMLIGAVGQMALVLGGISLPTSFVTGGIGIMPVLLWFGATAFIVLRGGQLPAIIGWLLVASLGLALLLTLASMWRLGIATWALSVALLVALCGWYGALGLELLQRA